MLFFLFSLLNNMVRRMQQNEIWDIQDLFPLLQGQDVGKTDFDRRLLCIDKEIIGARNTKIQQGMLDKSKEPFSVRAKPFWDVSVSRKVGYS